jgi:hypothetical protein
MTGIPDFFVVAFSDVAAGEPRLDVAMKALDERHAHSLAAHLAGQGRSTVAFARPVDLPAAEVRNVEILARYGEPLPDDPNLSVLGVRLGLTNSLVEAAEPPAKRSLWSALPCIVPFPLERKRRSRSASKLSRMIALLFVLALLVPGGSLMAWEMRASEMRAQREARLMQMTQSVCGHDAMANQELHRLIGHELETGLSKRGAFYVVAFVCQSNSRAGGASLPGVRLT